MLQNENAPQTTERNRRIRKKKRSPLFWTLRILMVISFCCFLAFLAQLVVPKIQASSVKNRIPVPGTSNVTVQTQETTTPDPEAADSSAAPEGPAKSEETDEDAFNSEDTAPISEDFLELKSMNPDVMGWLTAADKINYPVVRHKEDENFYLDHSFFGESDFNGSIFLSQYNVLRPRDTILQIYGHFLATGDMFGTLPKYTDESYMRQHALIEFRTVFADETGSDWYVPVAMFSASMDGDEPQYFDIHPVNFESKGEYREYLKEMLDRSLWKAPTDVDTDDELIVLITCSYNFINSRHLLFCRRLRADETPEQMQALYLNQA